MDRPQYLSNYNFDWELFSVFLSGKSALDTRTFMTPMENFEQVEDFMVNYGFDPSNAVLKSELFGYFQEAIQFIKRYFLIEGNSEGIDLKIPNSIFTITDVSDLFLMATGKNNSIDAESRIWSGIILKVMHTILHADKDLRSNYFNVIQQQIFDRFYKVIFRDEEDHLFLGKQGGDVVIPLVDFQTKSKKARDSVIIKMLHKVENVAEELFDRVGVRFVTKTKLDTLRVIKYLNDRHVIIPQNIKPSRSRNTIIDLESFRRTYKETIKNSIREGWDEHKFNARLQEMASHCQPQGSDDSKNRHSSEEYRSMQFTCRQLIIFKNPIMNQLSEMRKIARKIPKDNDLAKKVLGVDMKLVARDIRFFYPYEVQIVDEESHRHNTEGEASHEEYKKAQQNSAMKRIFKELLEFKGITTT